MGGPYSRKSIRQNYTRNFKMTAATPSNKIRGSETILAAIKWENHIPENLPASTKHELQNDHSNTVRTRFGDQKLSRQ
ncbi:hypothetical protein CEXT_224371 [Caerostris extrusa]|uniref:Uncharacterized protein n=1 Tax=Caerostris extrusa TaxID=172846 RepID=A0AAV4VCE8_CAEEX|nr:hypothetical protein CEXT_224371 [Caerostris extrusa]